MTIVKHDGKVVGAKLTAAEKKAMDIEIKRELVKLNEQNMMELDAIILWVLHEELGFGHKRLRRFYECFNKSVNDLNARYEFAGTAEDKIWLCTHKLKEYGIDIEKWNKETITDG